MKYLVAVSGGIDSVVLLHQLVKEAKHELIVAHFDHGIRSDSVGDARFVSGLAAYYNLPYVTLREELGAGASEDLARRRRYVFLRKAAQQRQANLVTAHHGDDIVETIAINLSRGTGWRGVAVLSANDIIRPLLGVSKQTLRRYAVDQRLEWVEDSTNATSDYLRNRLRRTIYSKVTTDERHKILQLHARQIAIKAAIEEQTQRYVRIDRTYSRYLLTQSDTASAYELLRAAVMATGAPGPTRPQLQRALLAVKTIKSDGCYELGAGVKLVFSVRSFTIQTI